MNTVRRRLSMGLCLEQGPDSLFICSDRAVTDTVAGFRTVLASPTKCHYHSAERTTEREANARARQAVVDEARTNLGDRGRARQDLLLAVAELLEVVGGEPRLTVRLNAHWRDRLRGLVERAR